MSCCTNSAREESGLLVNPAYKSTKVARGGAPATPAAAAASIPRRQGGQVEDLGGVTFTARTSRLAALNWTSRASLPARAMLVDARLRVPSTWFFSESPTPTRIRAAAHVASGAGGAAAGGALCSSSAVRKALGLRRRRRRFLWAAKRVLRVPLIDVLVQPIRSALRAQPAGPARPGRQQQCLRRSVGSPRRAPS